jgi:23S rRNA (cytidine2498-2'-O)-methyltransferase
MTAWTGYIAPEGFADDLRAELTRAGVPIAAVHGRLFLCPDSAMRPAWAQNIWWDVLDRPVASIKAAARDLKTMQRNWALLATDGPYRRARLIAEQLPYVAFRPLNFPEPPPAAPLGGWTLVAPDRMLAAPRTASPFPHGEASFVEDRAGPPSRAYLKLWEALTVLGTRPRPGELCLDLGAAPGGWTWALAELGARVIAVDKAPLDADVAARPEVAVTRDSAFGLRPRHVGPVDWLFSDVVCYPAKLLDLVERWRAAGTVRNIVCTVKFQGATDFETIDAFKAIPGGRLLHLHHNKHELTWAWLGDPPR